MNENVFFFYRKPRAVKAKAEASEDKVETVTKLLVITPQLNTALCCLNEITMDTKAACLQCSSGNGSRSMGLNRSGEQCDSPCIYQDVWKKKITVLANRQFKHHSSELKANKRAAS